MSERKALNLQLKADDEGSFKAVFATFDVVDLHGDVTRPGAFKDGAEVIVGAWGHNPYQLPVGRGVIVTDRREASVEGRFFLDTDHGRATYQTLKALGDLAEWSYVYDVEQESFGDFQGQKVRFLERVRVLSVDPVLAGAGIDTRTVSIKSEDGHFIDHSERIADEVRRYVERVKERRAIREKEGRMLSAANVQRLTTIAESLRSCVDDLDALLEAAEMRPRKGNEELWRLYCQSQRILSTIRG